MTQPVLTAVAELAALLIRYDYGAMPPGIAARVAELKHLIECEKQAGAMLGICPEHQARGEERSAQAA